MFVMVATSVLDVAGVIVGLAVGAASLYLIVTRSWFRLVFTTLGTLVVLGGRSLSPAELAYLVGIVVSVGMAVFAIERDSPPWIRSFARIQYILIAVLGLAAIVGAVNGNDTTRILRDAAPLGLLAAASLVAADSGRAMSERDVVRWFGIAAGIALIAFMAEWLQKRNAIFGADLPEVFLNTPFVPVAFWCLAIITFVRRGTYAWFLIIASVPALMLATGSRTYFVLFLAPLVVASVLWARKGTKEQWIRLGQVVLFGVVGGAVIFGAVLAVGVIDASRITDRLGTVTRVLEDPFSVQSLDERRRVTELAWESFAESPVVGNGLGTTFLWERRRQRGQPVDAPRGFIRRLTMDTTLTTPAKIGIVGLGAVLVSVSAAVWATRDSGRWRDTMITYLVMAALIGIFFSMFENKGFAVALAFLIAGAVSRRTRVGPELESEEPAEPVSNSVPSA